MNNFLEEAKLAKHKVLTGKSALVVQKDGRRIQYNPANLTELERYIETLEAEASGKTFRRGPARVSF